MVKPPSSMRPEAVDLSKAGRAHTKSFQESSFHNYMARKIHLQRRQFGLLVPPPPTPPPLASAGLPTKSNRSGTLPAIEPKPQLLLQLTPRRTSRKPARFAPTTSPAGEESSSPSGKSVRISETSSSAKKRGVPTADLGGLLKRLKRRHGDVPAAISTPADALTSRASLHSQQSLEATRIEAITLFQDNVQNANAASIALASAAPDRPTRDGPTSNQEGGSAGALADASPPCQTLHLQRSSEDGTASGDGGGGGSRSRGRPDLFFTGVVVIINGYSEPDAGTLQRMLHRHGGDVEKYETDHVTAVIASELSHAKAEVYRNLTRRPLPVIKPAWIVDCVRAHALLPYQGYILGRLRINKYGGTVQSISRFFPSKAAEPLNGSDGSMAPDFDTKRSSRCDSSKCTSSALLSLPLPAEPASEKDKRGADRVGAVGAVRWASDGDSHPVAKCVSISVDLTTECTVNDEHDRRLQNSQIVGAKGPGCGVVGTSAHVHSPSSDQDGIRDATSPRGKLGTREIGVPDCELTTEVTEPLNDAMRLLHGTPAAHDSADNDGLNGEGTHATPTCHVQLAQTQDSSREDDDEEGGGATGDGLRPPNVTTSAATEGAASTISCRPELFEPGGHSTSRTDEKHINGRLRTVGTDPKFLENFFSKSRLSFIGSFKQRARSSPEKVTNKTKQSSTDTRRWVLHVDIDSFFASVVLRDYPQYRDMPVVISHQGNGNQLKSNYSSASTSECATCNYKARELGIKKGMFLGRAHELSKASGFQLVVLPYDFDGYEEVKEKVAEVLFRYASEFNGRVNQVSCDESYMEIFLPVRPQDSTVSAIEAEQAAQSIRREIFEATECTASIGVAKNMFLAKLATDSVKPDGCCVVQDYRKLLSPLNLRQLPGIGYHLEEKLCESGLSTVQQVWDLGDRAHRVLEGILGDATGKKIHNFCLGNDERPVVASERKSIGAECSYGVRFDGEYGPDYMISCLAIEVVKRMKAVGVRGGSKVTLKIKKRRPNAKPPMKFLGHGSCDNFSKSCDVPAHAAVFEAELLTNLCLTLYRQLGVSNEDVRGMGIVVTKLTFVDAAGSVTSDAACKQPNLRSWLGTRTEPFKAPTVSSLPLASTSSGAYRLCARAPGKEFSSKWLENETESDCIEVDPGFELPSMSQIRLSQVECLPSPMKRYALSKMKAGREQERGTTASLVETRKRKLQQPKLAHFPAKALPSGAANRTSGKSRRRAMTCNSICPTLRQKHFTTADSKSLFEDDVYPLSLFMDENPSADADSRDHVAAFLLVCVREERLGDVVVLLRSIRNRKDRWGDAYILQPILDRVNDAVEATEGSRLDMDWI